MAASAWGIDDTPKVDQASVAKKDLMSIKGLTGVSVTWLHPVLQRFDSPGTHTPSQEMLEHLIVF